MRRAFYISVSGLFLGVFAYFVGIVPQQVFAASQRTSGHVAVTVPAQQAHDQTTTGMHIRVIDRLPDKTHRKSEEHGGKSFQHSLTIPWPLIKTIDLSYLWKQQRDNQKKDIYDYGQ